MNAKSSDPTKALVAVLEAIDPLTDPERNWVLNSAASRWNINLLSTDTEILKSDQIQNEHFAGSTGKKGSSARSFLREKKPISDVQRIACLTYYVSNKKGEPGVTSKEISDAHTESGEVKFNISRALDNATRQSKFLSTLSRNSKQLTPLGEDIVDALPDQEAVNTLLKEGRTRRPRRAKKAPKKTKK